MTSKDLFEWICVSCVGIICISIALRIGYAIWKINETDI